MIDASRIVLPQRPIRRSAEDLCSVGAVWVVVAQIIIGLRIKYITTPTAMPIINCAVAPSAPPAYRSASSSSRLIVLGSSMTGGAPALHYLVDYALRPEYLLCLCEVVAHVSLVSNPLDVPLDALGQIHLRG